MHWSTYSTRADVGKSFSAHAHGAKRSTIQAMRAMSVAGPGLGPIPARELLRQVACDIVVDRIEPRLRRTRRAIVAALAVRQRETVKRDGIARVEPKRRVERFRSGARAMELTQ